MDDEYETTVAWAEQEEQLRLTRGQPVSNFYLFSMIFVILGICLLVLYLWNRGEKSVSALDLARDPDNVLMEKFSQTEVDEIGVDGDGDGDGDEE